MCGIAGIINFNGIASPLFEDCKKLNSLIKHRGPDDEGYCSINNGRLSLYFGEDTPSNVKESNYIHSPKQSINNQSTNSNLILAHRRLSVLDVSAAGHQPTIDESKNHALVYNGEIYNYKELRNELTHLGVKFITNCDTEVVFHALITWGKNAVKKFNGMWTLAFWNKKQNTVLFSRDRTGVKPLYYLQNKQKLFFASELKALRPFMDSSRTINGSSALEFLAFNQVERNENSIFNGVKELPPSTNLIVNINSGELTSSSYFTSSGSNNSSQIEDTREQIVEAVRIRLQSDVKIGTCLSGGIDSSGIVGIICDELNKNNIDSVGSKLTAISCTFPNTPFNESNFAELAVKNKPVNWITTTPNADDLLTDFTELTYCQDVPLLSTSTYAQYSVMKKANEQGIKVLLDGQGADELFGGYHQHFIALWNSYLRTGKINKFINEMNAFTAFSSYKYLIKYNLKHLIKQSSLLLNNSYALNKFIPELKYLNPAFVSAFLPDVEVKESPINDVNNILHDEYYNGPLKRLLKCEDRCSMHFSIESRTPFADDNILANAVFNIVGNKKIVNGVSKNILREALKPFIPKEIYNRKDKKGFLTPNNQWMAELSPTIIELVNNCDSNIFNKKNLTRDLQLLTSQVNAPENYRTFKLFSFMKWQHTFNMSL